MDAMPPSIASSPVVAVQSSSSRRAVSFWILLVLGILLGASALTNVALSWLAFRGIRQALYPPSGFQERVLAGNPHSTDKILDIKLTGAIFDFNTSSLLGGVQNPVTAVLAQLDAARKDPAVKGILLEINSPGGGITASDILYHELKRFRVERKIPVVVLCQDLTASGGYYVAMAANEVMAHRTSLVGSIGVIAEFGNISELMHKIGVKMNVIKSLRADGTESFKDMGSMFRPMKPVERAMMQRMVQSMWRRFVTVVATGRAGKLTRAQVEKLADGRIWTGGEALRLGLIDGLGYREDAWRKVQTLAGAPGARLVAWSRARGLLTDLVGAHAQPPSLQALFNQTLDPVAGATPHMLFLWSVR